MSVFTDLFPKKKIKAAALYTANFLKKVRTGAQVADDRENQTNEDLTQLRYGISTEKIVRDIANTNPDVSHAVEMFMRFGITDSFTQVAKELETDTIEPNATRLVQTFASRLNKLPIRFDGFSPQSTINSTSETLLKQLLTNGCCMAELVLDKTMLPSFIQAISTNNLKYESTGDRYIPYLDESSGKTYLDSPAVSIISLSQDPETPYSTSWFKSAIQSVISSTEFTQDLRKSFRKASLPRVTATIDSEKFSAMQTPDTLQDPKKMKVEVDSVLLAIENQVNGLQPEDALVNFDFIKIDHLSAGNISAHESVKTHAEIVNGQMSTGLHTLPSILGRGESQSTASTETVLFLKMVESLQGRLNEVFSYLLTMAARLHGHDVTVSFKFKKPSLRPEIEEEAFQSMRQSRIREQWSDGLISDEEASILLTGDLPSGNFKPLSGTGFFNKAAETEDNPYSNTSVSGEQTNNTKDQKDRQTGSANQSKTNSNSG